MYADSSKCDDLLYAVKPWSQLSWCAVVSIINDAIGRRRTNAKDATLNCSTMQIFTSDCGDH